MKTWKTKPVIKTTQHLSSIGDARPGMSLNGVIAVNTAHSITSYPTAEEYNFDSGRIPSAVNMSAFVKS